MANYGFLIDLRRCIGCHACTIACKAEHDIPIGVNRCWVKTVERGTFPDTRRSFLPVLCNQCEDAPCVRICPTRALFRRQDGIVDVDPESCIGCRACMQACPYDQLFIDPGTRTAEKCNFCANRVENRLQPSCVSVCPTQCRVFGDLDDPNGELSLLLQRDATTVRKPEKGTGPKVFYVAADESALRPEHATRPIIFKEGQVAIRPLGALAEDPASPGAPRVDYDVPHDRPWGLDLVVYLAAKGVSAGASFFTALCWMLGFTGALVEIAGPAIAVLFAAITAGVLVWDLERPARFYYILTRSNWRSWLVWGAWALTAHGLLAVTWLAAAWFRLDTLRAWLVLPTTAVAALAAAYTSFLFAQGLGRDLWQGPYSAIDLLAQAGAGGAAAMILAAGLLPSTSDTLLRLLAAMLAGCVVAHLALLAIEYLLAPSPTRHHELAVRAILRGPYALSFWGMAVLAGGLVPAGLLLTPLELPSAVASLAASLALAGGLAWDYLWIEAGQSVPLS